MKPTLLVLAAGMGSRYGSLKQMDAVGPSGEAILDYSVYDAIRGGFGRVVFVIRESFAADFRNVFNAKRFGDQIKVDYVYQELDALPAGFDLPEGRQKPWGTNHAILVAARAIDTNFAVINADDFYGQDAIAVMGRYLTSIAGQSNTYAMVGYEVSKTLSDNGSVSRGVCSVSATGSLESLVERTKVQRIDGRVVYTDETGNHPLPENSPVSMNLFGFTPDYFRYSEEFFKTFLSNPANHGSEYYISLAVNKLVDDGTVTMTVLSTTSNWFGVTYKEDKPDTIAKINELIAQRAYPTSLWGAMPQPADR